MAEAMTAYVLHKSDCPALSSPSVPREEGEMKRLFALLFFLPALLSAQSVPEMVK